MTNTDKKYKALVSIIVFLLVTNFAMLIFFLVIDKPADKRWKEHTENSFSGSLESEVGFSKAQIEQYQELKTLQRKNIKPLFDKVRKSKQDFYELLYLPNVSDSLLIADADSIAQTQRTLDMQMFQHFKRVRAICTHDQLQRFDSTLKKAVVRMTGRSGKGRSSR